MQRKKNEVELGQMMRSYGFYTKKSRDRGYISCPKCHRPVTKCPTCHGDMLLNKAETMPDFLVAFDYIYIEGKGGTDSWNFKTSITPTQDKVCLEHESWLFLELGPGRAPEGRSAWLVPWTFWKNTQNNLEEQGFASIIYEGTERSRNPVAGDLLGHFAMIWKNGGWKIPKEHLFWMQHPLTIHETENDEEEE
jgi:hypothetical protein